jgi:2-polyprenyl-6-methoxyphenol hydroxylase-like FAD-dependent oxidoreductase
MNAADEGYGGDWSRRSGQSEHSKALAVMPRTLEIFDMAGVAESIVEKANRVTWAVVVPHGHTLARIHFSPEETPYHYVAMVPQDVTEKVLAEELRRKGGAVEYQTTFVTAVEKDGCVSATLDRRASAFRSSPRLWLVAMVRIARCGIS